MVFSDLLVLAVTRPCQGFSEKMELAVFVIGNLGT